MSFDDIRALYPGDYTVYPAEKDGTYQANDRNLHFFMDSKGPTWIEFGVIIYQEFEEAKALDFEGLTSSHEIEFKKWCHKMNIKYKKKLLETDERGDTSLLEFPSGADVLISRGTVQRIAKLY